MINFPDNPSNNQVFTSGNQTWVYDGTKWLAMGVAGGIYLPLSGGILTGPLTPAGGIVGVTDGSSAAPGVIGEVITAKPSAIVPLTSTVVTQIAVLNLTPGDWDVRATVNVSASAAVLSSIATNFGVASGAGVSNPPFNGAVGSIGGPSFTSAYMILPPVQLSFNVTTPIYLNAQGTFASGTAQANTVSWIQARRMR